MGDAGGDLWSPVAVGVLKQHLSKQMSEAWLEVLDTLVEAKVETKDADETTGEEVSDAKDADGSKAEEEATEQEPIESAAAAEQQDLRVQWLMDIYYLGLFLGPNQVSMKELEEAVYQKSGLETPAKERLAKASQEYYKRTNLLFGLLT
jgi:hypothetical protein